MGNGSITLLRMVRGMVYALPDWYKKQREEFLEHFESVCDDPHRVPEKSIRASSPSGMYVLDVAVHRTGSDPKTPSWEYSRGVMVDNKTQEKIADIKRNFGHFPYAWVRQNQKEYLICGEDYQGYSVVDLERAKTHVFIPSEALSGTGFCWAEIKPSSSGKYLLVDGCYWACDYELRLYDFSKPTELPIPMVANLSYLYGNPYEESVSLHGKWLDDRRIEIEAVVYNEGLQPEKSVRVWTVEEVLSRGGPDKEAET